MSTKTHKETFTVTEQMEPGFYVFVSIPLENEGEKSFREIVAECEAFGVSPKETQASMKYLMEIGTIRRRVREGQSFWCIPVSNTVAETLGDLDEPVPSTLDTRDPYAVPLMHMTPDQQQHRKLELLLEKVAGNAQRMTDEYDNWEWDKANPPMWVNAKKWKARKAEWVDNFYNFDEFGCSCMDKQLNPIAHCKHELGRARRIGEMTAEQAGEKEKATPADIVRSTAPTRRHKPTRYNTSGYRD